MVVNLLTLCAVIDVRKLTSEAGENELGHGGAQARGARRGDGALQDPEVFRRPRTCRTVWPPGGRRGRAGGGDPRLSGVSAAWDSRPTGFRGGFLELRELQGEAWGFWNRGPLTPRKPGAPRSEGWGGGGSGAALPGEEAPPTPSRPRPGLRARSRSEGRPVWLPSRTKPARTVTATG